MKTRNVRKPLGSLAGVVSSALLLAFAAHADPTSSSTRTHPASASTPQSSSPSPTAAQPAPASSGVVSQPEASQGKPLIDPQEAARDGQIGPGSGSDPGRSSDAPAANERAPGPAGANEKGNPLDTTVSPGTPDNPAKMDVPSGTSQDKIPSGPTGQPGADAGTVDQTQVAPDTPAAGGGTTPDVGR